MAKSVVHLTPVSNVKDGKLVDKTNVFAREFDSLTDSFTFINMQTNEERVGNLMQASLYDDVMVYNDRNHRILYMNTKG